MNKRTICILFLILLLFSLIPQSSAFNVCPGVVYIVTNGANPDEFFEMDRCLDFNNITLDTNWVHFNALGFNISADDQVFVNISQINADPKHPVGTPYIISFNVSASVGTVVTFRLSGLKTSQTYTLYNDSVSYAIKTNASGTLRFNRSSWAVMKHAYVLSDSILTFEYDTERGKYPDIIKLNDSEYYLIAADGDSSTKEGMLYTIQVLDNSGSIKQSNVSWWKYDSSTAVVYPAVDKIPETDKYVVSYIDTGPNPDLAKVFVVNVSDTTGLITNGFAGTVTLANTPGQNKGFDVLYLNGRNVIVAYNGTSGLILSDVCINSTGKIWKENSTVIVNKTCDSPKLCKIDNDTIAVVYHNTTTSGTRNFGFLATYDVSSTGVLSFVDRWNITDAVGVLRFLRNPDICHVDRDTYAIACSGVAYYLKIKTININSTGIIVKRWVDNQTITSTSSNYPYLYRVSGKIFSVTYQGSGDIGKISTLNISNDGYVGTALNTSIFSSECYWTAPIVWSSLNHYLVVYSGNDTGGVPWTNYDGYATIADITTTYDKPVVVDTNPTNNSMNLSLSFVYRCNIQNRNGTFNWSIECNGLSNSSTYEKAGDKYLTVSGLSYDTTYTVYINVSKGSTYNRYRFYFTTALSANCSLLNLVNAGASIMFIEAHPDDEGYIIPGLMEYAHRLGNDVYVLCIKNVSQASSPEEVQVYNDWLNNSYLTWFHYMGINTDSWGDAEKQDAEDKILENITLYNPDIVITYSPYGYVDNAGQSAHQNVSSIVSQAYDNVSGVKPYLYWGIDTGQDLGADVEYTLYPPTDVISYDFNNSWDNKVSIWAQLSFVVASFNTQLRNNTWYDENDRCEYFFDSTNLTKVWHKQLIWNLSFRNTSIEPWKNQSRWNISFRNSSVDTPTVLTNTTTGVNATNATMHGYIVNQGASNVTSVGFQYGLTSGLGSVHIVTYEEYTAGYNTGLSIYNIVQGSQTFTVGSTGENNSHLITGVSLQMYRNFLPGTVTVNITAVNATERPTGPPLAQGTTNGNTLGTTSGVPLPVWRRINFTSSCTLIAGTKYAIVVSTHTTSAVGLVIWCRDNTAPTYPGGIYMYSTDRGVNWIKDSGSDFMFQEHGINTAFSYNFPAAPATRYFHRAFANNSYGTGTGNITQFLTEPLPPIVVTATVISGGIKLDWTNPAIGAGVNRSVMIRYSNTTYPTSISDGTLIENATSPLDTDSYSFMHIGSFYFSLWTYDECSGMHHFSATYATSSAMIGGTYNITVLYENWMQGFVNLSKFGPHKLTIYGSNNTREINFQGYNTWGDLKLNLSRGSVRHQLTHGYLSFNLTFAPYQIELRWNNSDSIAKRCYRTVTVGTNKNLTFYIITDKFMYDGYYVTEFNNTLVKWTYSFIDYTGVFLVKPELDTYVYVYTYTPNGTRMIIHSEYLDTNKKVYPTLIYGKKYYIGIACSVSIIDNIGFAPTETDTSKTTSLYVSIDSDVADTAPHYTIKAHYTHAATGLYVYYSDPTLSVASSWLRVYDYANGSLMYSNSSTASVKNFTFPGALHNRSYIIYLIINGSSPGIEYIVYLVPGLAPYWSYTATGDFLETIFGSTPFRSYENPSSTATVPWIDILVFVVFCFILFSIAGYNAALSGLASGGWFIFAGAYLSGSPEVFVIMGIIILFMSFLYAWGERS